MTAQELVLYAVREAQLILAAHIDQGPRDPEETITRLMEVLDRRDVVTATRRLCLEFGLRPNN